MFSHQLFANENIHEWVIAFYGYGQSAQVYEPLYERIKEKKNLLVIDLPSFDYEDDIYPEDLKEYISALLDQNNIKKFQSVSFSIGGRLNLFMPLFFSDQLSKLIVVAPDIGVNFWNKLATHTIVGSALFRFFVQRENVYLSLINFLHKMGLLHKAVYTFTKWSMRDKVQRTKVYNTWMNMRRLVPKLTIVQQCIENHKMDMVTYFGKQDKLITKQIYTTCKKEFPNAKHNLLDIDHNLMKPDFFTLLAQELI